MIINLDNYRRWELLLFKQVATIKRRVLKILEQTTRIVCLPHQFLPRFKIHPSLILRVAITQPANHKWWDLKQVATVKRRVPWYDPLFQIFTKNTVIPKDFSNNKR